MDNQEVDKDVLLLEKADDDVPERKEKRTGSKKKKKKSTFKKHGKRSFSLFQTPMKCYIPKEKIPLSVKAAIHGQQENLDQTELDKDKDLSLFYTLKNTLEIPKDLHLESLKVLLYIEHELRKRENGGQLKLSQKPISKLDRKMFFRSYPMNCNFFALRMMEQFKLAPFLHPEVKEMHNFAESREFWFNEDIKTNREQKQAVEHIVAQTAKPAPYILFGPPGTGKTATLVEAICQIWREDPSNRVLICTPSNAAADEVCRRLLQYIPPIDILRYFSPSRNPDAIPMRMMKCTNFVDGIGIVMPKDILLMKKIVISTLTNCIRLVGMKLRPSYFNYIFIDEGGQSMEPETLIPFLMTSSIDKQHCGRIHSQIVIAGDPHQLGPIIKSAKTSAAVLLEISMIERLMDLCIYKKTDKFNPNYITKLVKNFRSHGAILKISNEIFYENELQVCGGNSTKIAEKWNGLTNKKFPIIFHGVDGEEAGMNGSPSSFNLQEIDIIEEYVVKLTSGLMKDKGRNIGIVTPFKLQECAIKQRLIKIGKSEVSVGTVNLFQGQERDVIIISTVRSRLFENSGTYHMGFLSDKKRFNVAVTRAKALLIVIGNPNILKLDPCWGKFLRYCVENNAFAQKGLKFKMKNLTADEKKSLSERLKHMYPANYL